jgi:hypothetical protein
MLSDQRWIIRFQMTTFPSCVDVAYEITMSSNEAYAALTQAILRVGDGRGFAVNLEHQYSAVITAAHCLPRLPSCHPGAYSSDRTYKALLGPLAAEPTVWAECLFADPIADIAVLGMPDDQELPDEADSYNRLLGSRQPLLITDAPAREQSCPARPFSLDGKWFECSINRWNAWLSVEPADVVAPGMSGSPIISLDGRAFGLLSSPDQNPILMDDLPRRILSEMISAEAGDYDL